MLFRSHLQSVGNISIREAMDDYGLSGGSLTKVISDLKKAGHNIVKAFRKHPITGKRYARYTYSEPVVFKVGDKVKMVKPCKDEGDPLINSTGVITEEECALHAITVAWDNFREGWGPSNNKWDVRRNQIELIK